MAFGMGRLMGMLAGCCGVAFGLLGLWGAVGLGVSEWGGVLGAMWVATFVATSLYGTFFWALLPFHVLVSDLVLFVGIRRFGDQEQNTV